MGGLLEMGGGELVSYHEAGRLDTEDAPLGYLHLIKLMHMRLLHTEVAQWRLLG